MIAPFNKDKNPPIQNAWMGGNADLKTKCKNESGCKSTYNGNQQTTSRMLKKVF
mgnify:CR=1 FL=1